MGFNLFIVFPHAWIWFFYAASINPFRNLLGRIKGRKYYAESSLFEVLR